MYEHFSEMAVLLVCKGKLIIYPQVGRGQG